MLKTIKSIILSKQGSISMPAIIPLIMMLALILGVSILDPTARQIMLSPPVQIIKNVLFIIVLIFASKQDLKEFQVSNWYSVALLAIGLIGVGVDNLIGAAICYCVFFFVAMLTNLGGADVKIAGCCGFVLGTLPSLIALLIGLSISIILEAITSLIKKDGIKRTFPLVPYITSGCVAMTILKGINIL